MSFKQIIGHEVPIRLLRNSLEKNRVGMSYLFHGPSGIGKAFTAKQFAKALNCESKTQDSCDSCISCRKIDALQYPDMHWLDFEEESDSIKIEQIRLMQNEINLRPFEGEVKVFVINNCDSLTLEAANCLLKVLEEPPGDSVIILISSRLRNLLPTIISRCQKIKFSSLKRIDVEEILKNTYKLDSLSSHYLAYYLDGRLGEAITLSKGDFLGEKNAIIDKFFHPNQREFEGLFADRFGAKKVLSVLSGWFRDLIYAKIDVSHQHLINIDRASDIDKYALRYTYTELIDAFNYLSRSHEYLKQNVNIRLLADSIRVKIWKN